MVIHLVGGIPTPLKNMKVSWDDDSQYMGKYKMFQTTNQLLIYESHVFFIYLCKFINHVISHGI